MDAFNPSDPSGVPTHLMEDVLALQTFTGGEDGEGGEGGEDGLHCVSDVSIACYSFYSSSYYPVSVPPECP